MLSCNCLNVVIECETGDFLKVTDYEEYKLTNEEQRDNFFKMEHYKCTKIPDITTRQTLMQDERQVGDWQIYRCINCDMSTHAINKYKGPSWALFPTYLLTFQKIKELRASKRYSKCFNIILPEKVDKAKLKEVHPCIMAELKCHEGNFIKQFHQFKDRERQACQERISQYVEIQNALVNDLVESEEHFLEAMKWKFIEDKHNKMLTQTNQPPIDVPSNTSWKEKYSAVEAPVTMRIDRQNSRKQNYLPEDVFEMEDMDGLDNSQPHSHSEDESDQDNDNMPSEDNGIQIQRQRTNSTSIAKSLPITIPSFLAAHRKHANEDSDDSHQEEGKVDIAASIKALARSVHGEAVFGELPRPRFSSQI